MSGKPIQDLRNDMASLVRAVTVLGEELRRMEKELTVRLDNLTINARAQSAAFDTLLDTSSQRSREIVDQRIDALRLGLKSEIDERMGRCGVCAEQIGSPQEVVT